MDPRLSDALALASVLGVGVEELAGHSAPVARRAGRPPPRPPVQRGAARDGAHPAGVRAAA